MFTRSISLAGALTLTMLLIACATPAFGCSDQLGCVKIDAGKPVVIGAILATAGKEAAQGLQTLHSVELAVNDKGTLLDHPVKLIHYGTDCSDETARSAATEFSTYFSELIVVIGPTCSNETEIVGSILTAAGISVLAPLGDPAGTYSQTIRLFSIIEQVAIRSSDGSLSIPRQALSDAIQKIIP